LHLGTGKNGGCTRRALRAIEAVQPGERLRHDLAIQEQECSQGLILGRGCHPPVAGEMVEKRRDLRLAQIERMTLAVKKDEALDPVNVAFLSAGAEVLAPDGIPHLLHKFRFRCGHWSPRIAAAHHHAALLEPRLCALP